MKRERLLTCLGLAFLCGLVMAGCWGSSNDGEVASGLITDQGGDVAVPGGEALLTFPPGAVSDDVDVTISVVSDDNVENLVTKLYELGPGGVDFQVPVTLTIQVPAGVQTDGIYVGRVVDAQAVKLDSSQYDPETRQLSAQLTSFSLYGGFVPPSATTCQACVEEQCPAQMDACEGNPSCLAILDCVVSCENDDCIENCIKANPGGAAFFEGVTDCAGKKCPSCGDVEPDEDDCETCLESHCQSQHKACTDSSPCAALIACIDLCWTEDDSDVCVDDCFTLYPEAQTLIGPLEECIEQQCPVCLEEPDDTELIAVSYNNGTLYMAEEDSLEGQNTVWGLEGTQTKATSVSNGASNTEITVGVLGNIGTNYAALLCSEMESNGYTDWYLPSRDELNAVYKARGTIENIGQGWYWSSTEDDDEEEGPNRAWIQNFQDGYAHVVSKGLLGRVRCVRKNTH